MDDVFDNGITEDTMCKILQHANKLGYSKPSCNITRGSEKGDNFVGIVSRIIISDENDLTKTLNIIVKGATSDVTTRETMGTHGFFCREVWTYQTLLPAFRDIYLELPAGDLMFPECLSASNKDNNEWLALEDMSSKGFQLHRPRLSTLDKVHMEAALAALAHFHAMSFVMKSRDPKLFEELCQQAPDVIFLEEQQKSLFKEFFEKAIENVLDIIEDKIHRTKLQKIRHGLFEKVSRVVHDGECNVFCHGDYWKNNMLFKYQNGLPTAVCFLDFQIVRVSSPATDILYLLFCSTSAEDRALHYEHYLHYYHQRLCTYLEVYGLQRDVLPLSTLLSEIRRCALYGLLMAINVLVFITCPSDNVPEIKDAINGDMGKEISKGNALYVERIQALITDCVNYGYI